MKLKAKTLAKQDNGMLKPIAKGTLLALCVSLCLILIFAFILRFTAVSDSLISPVNEVIKGLSIFLGVFFGMKKVKKNGILSGFLIGFCFTILAFFVFSLLDGEFTFDQTFLYDMIFGSIIGAICGIICVNLKKI